MDILEFEKLKKRIGVLVEREFDSTQKIEDALTNLKDVLEDALPKDKTEDRIDYLKGKFFALDKKIGTSNYKEIKEEKKELLYKILLEKKEVENEEEMIENIKKNLRFVFMLRIEDYEKLSYTRYCEIRGTCTTHPYAEIAKDLPRDSKLVDMLLDKTEKLDQMTPGSNRLMYVVYCHDTDEEGNLVEYIYPHYADEKTVKQKFSTLFPGHLHMAIEFIKNGAKQANLMERFLACFGVKNVHVFLTDYVAINNRARRDPIKMKLKDYYTKEFGKWTKLHGNDLRKSPLGFCE